VARTRLFAWLVFNALAGNSDAHLKNLSFLVLPTGIQPAPHYDLLSAAVYDSRAYGKPGWPANTTLAWPVMGVQRFADINRAVMIKAGRAMGIQQATVVRLLDRQRDRIVAAAEQHNAELEAAADGTVTPAGETRCVRAIIHTVIRQMVAQLA